MPLSPRLILVHKQSTSGRLRFLSLPDGMLAFVPLPESAALRDEDYPVTVEIHPAAVIRAAESRLALPENSIEPVADFHCWADTPDGDIPILLAAFTTIDPPFAAAEGCGGRFIAITEARRASEVERNVMRRAYEFILG